ncbi:hypothetical protein BCR33DRAFT_860029 [Rhizoclosmatium globosum]|uniref:NACHT domain-containing protein n=1 Tax=Rhizoclosmatium globosum TaxID=329046 RepID=A0A1Y2AQV8_9FUNG|nr:hypothetical protein BCR33DRAFT_860029 [Rhizoclosmatium globosum]|eukprot:ORY24943.1 hypothetical protein BCR33DRAFT_860029 [Rhizoclosmatium globosum]
MGGEQSKPDVPSESADANSLPVSLNEIVQDATTAKVPVVIDSNESKSDTASLKTAVFNVYQAESDHANYEEPTAMTEPQERKTQFSNVCNDVTLNPAAQSALVVAVASTIAAPISALPDPATAAQTLNVTLVSIQPYKQDDARDIVELNEQTVKCLKMKIADYYPDLVTTSIIQVYYLLSTDGTRRMLSKQARLGNILRPLKNTLTDILFEFHSLYVVTISAKNGSNLPPVVVELKEADMNELLDNIILHFGCERSVKVYHKNKKSSELESVTNQGSLKRAFLDSCEVLFEPIKSVQDLSQAVAPIAEHNHATQILLTEVDAIVNKLETDTELQIWRDKKDMNDNIYESMGGGLAGCKAVVAFLSEKYLTSENCKKELYFAQELKKPIIPVYLFEEGTDIESLKRSDSGPFFIVTGKLYFDFKRMDANESKWSSKFNELLAGIHSTLDQNIPESLSSDLLETWLDPVPFEDDLEAYKAEYVPGTRLWMIPALEAWAQTGERVLYLNGGAGTGKSIIVYSLTVNLPSNFQVGALFICRYNNTRKSDPKTLVCTIVSGLCKSLGGIFKQHVEMVMEADTIHVTEGKQTLLQRPVEAFQVLVLDGLNKLLPEEWEEKTLLIVIDGLDELSINDRHYVLTILTKLCPKLPAFVKIFATGRPERDIYYELQDVSPFVLSPNQGNNQEDLEKFVNHCFGSLWGSIVPDSLESKCCKELMSKSEGLFIYARNICEYIKQQSFNPSEAYTVIQSLSSGVDNVYTAIMNRVLTVNRSEKLALFKNVFAVLLTVQKPLSLNALANIGGLNTKDVQDFVSEFRPILKIENGALSVIHKSVKDFFTDLSRCGPELFIHLIDRHLAVQCLQILMSKLSKNMAKLDPSKFYEPDELAKLTVLNEDVQYALLCWAFHFVKGLPVQSEALPMIKYLHQFCISVLPFYLEGILLMAKLNDVFPVVQSIASALSKYKNSEEKTTSLSVLNDLKFIGFNFRNQLLASPLQVYNHALIGVPQETVYYQLYHSFASARITVGAEKKWGPFTFVGHSSYVNSVAFSPDAKTVISGSSDNTVKFVALSPDAKTAISGSCDNTVKLWSVETGKCIKTLVGHSSPVLSVAFSPDSKTVVSGSGDKTIKLWSVETGECMKTLLGHSSFVTLVAFSPDSNTVVFGSSDNTVKLWSVETEECVKNIVGHSSSVAFSPDSKTVVSGSSDNTVKLWSVETGKCIKTLVGHSSSVTSVAFSPDSKTVVSGSGDKTVKLWSVETGECIKTLVGHSSFVRSVAFSPDSNTVVFGSNDNRVKLWSVKTEEGATTLDSHSDYITSVAFSPDSKTVVSGSGDKTVKFWSVETGEYVKTLVGHSSYVGSVAFSPDSKTVVSGSDDNTLKLWSVETGECIKTLVGHSSSVTSVAFSPDSKTIVSGSSDNFLKLLSFKKREGDMAVKLWSVETGKCIKTLVGHSSPVLSVAFSPDSKTVVSRSDDNTVNLWSAETGHLIKTVSILHQPSTPAIYTSHLHQASTPGFYTRILHQPSTPGFYTRFYTSHLHQPSTPAIYTRILHQDSTPAIYTRILHQDSTPAIYTSHLHQDSIPDSTPGISGFYTVGLG